MMWYYIQHLCFSPLGYRVIHQIVHVFGVAAKDKITVNSAKYVICDTINNGVTNLHDFVGLCMCSVTELRVCAHACIRAST